MWLVRKRERVQWGQQESWGLGNWDALMQVTDEGAVLPGIMGLLQYWVGYILPKVPSPSCPTVESQGPIGSQRERAMDEKGISSL